MDNVLNCVRLLTLKIFRVVLQASLAHKANHSFEPNGKFILFQHPRFGPVPAIVTTTEVK